jgi:predicted ATPase
MPARIRAQRASVGRQKELGDLSAAFESAAAGSGFVLCVAGEAGIGKSTLLEDFSVELKNQAVACYIASGRCSERLAGSEAYLPLLEAFESLLRSGGETVARIMKAVAPTWYVQVTSVSSGDSSAARLLADVKAASQERLKRELVAFVEEVSRLQPLVVFLDDMHWADASTTDLIAYIGTRLAPLRVLIVATYRSSELLLAKHPFVGVRQELQAHGVCRELSLALLSLPDACPTSSNIWRSSSPSILSRRIWPPRSTPKPRATPSLWWTSCAISATGASSPKKSAAGRWPSRCRRSSVNCRNRSAA